MAILTGLLNGLIRIRIDIRIMRNKTFDNFQTAISTSSSNRMVIIHSKGVSHFKAHTKRQTWSMLFFYLNIQRVALGGWPYTVACWFMRRWFEPKRCTSESPESPESPEPPEPPESPRAACTKFRVATVSATRSRNCDPLTRASRDVGR